MIEIDARLTFNMTSPLGSPATSASSGLILGYWPSIKMVRAPSVPRARAAFAHVQVPRYLPACAPCRSGSGSATGSLNVAEESYDSVGNGAKKAKAFPPSQTSYQDDCISAYQRNRIGHHAPARPAGATKSRD